MRRSADDPLFEHVKKVSDDNRSFPVIKNFPADTQPVGHAGPCLAPAGHWCDYQTLAENKDAQRLLADPDPGAVLD